MRPDEKKLEEAFQKDLDAVFGDRAKDMSGNTVEMLRRLWDAGRGQGRSENGMVTAMEDAAEAMQRFGTSLGKLAPFVGQPEHSPSEGKTVKVGSVTEYLKKVNESYDTPD